MNSTINAVFCYTMDDCPDDWHCVSLTDVSEMQSGYSYKGDELTEASNNALVTIKNFDRNGGFKIDGYKPI